MDEFIKTMIERMRSERCPERVLKKVRESIAADRRPAAFGNRLRVGLSLATAVVVVVGTVLFLLMPVPSIDQGSVNPPAPQLQTGPTNRSSTRRWPRSAWSCRKPAAGAGR